MTTDVHAISIKPRHRVSHVETAWGDIVEAGAYVEKRSGDLFRFPPAAIGQAGGPVIRQESLRTTRLVKVSCDSEVSLLEARWLCAALHITPNF